MNKYLLFEAMGEISDRHLEPLLAKLEPSPKRTKTPGRILRFVLIAAAMLALLAATAVAAYQLLGIQDLLIPPTELPPPQAETATLDPADVNLGALEEMRKQAERPYRTPNGNIDSPEYKASAEWHRFTTEYKYQKALEASAEGNNVFSWIDYDRTFLGGDRKMELFCSRYSVLDQTMLDELLSIAQRHNVKLLYEETLFKSEEQFFKLSGMNACVKDSDFSHAYMFEDGSFSMEGNVTLPSSQRPIIFSLTRTISGCLYPYSNHFDPELWDEREYTTTSGHAVYIELAEIRSGDPATPRNYTFILYDQDGVYLTLSAEWNIDESINGDPYETAVWLTEQICFDELLRVETNTLTEYLEQDRTANPAAEPWKLLTDFVNSGEYQANREFAEYCVVNMKPNESPHYIGMWDNKYESIGGCTGSFTGVYGSTGVAETDAAIQATAEKYGLLYPTYTEAMFGGRDINTYHTFWGNGFYDPRGTYAPITVEETYERLGQGHFSNIPLNDNPSAFMCGLYDTGAFVAMCQSPAFAVHYIPKGTFYTLLYNFAKTPEAYNQVWDYETACGERVVCAMTEGSKTPAPMVLYDTGTAWVVITADANAASLEATADVIDFTKFA